MENCTSIHVKSVISSNGCILFICRACSDSCERCPRDLIAVWGKGRHTDCDKTIKSFEVQQHLCPQKTQNESNSNPCCVQFHNTATTAKQQATQCVFFVAVFFHPHIAAGLYANFISLESNLSGTCQWTQRGTTGLPQFSNIKDEQSWLKPWHVFTDMYSLTWLWVPSFSPQTVKTVWHLLVAQRSLRGRRVCVCGVGVGGYFLIYLLTETNRNLGEAASPLK